MRQGQQTEWTARDGGGGMMALAMGALLLLVSFAFFGLPKMTGRSETLAVPIVMMAFAGWIIARAMRTPLLRFEHTTLVYALGKKCRAIDLARARYGYAKVRQPYIGNLGTALIVQDESGSLAIGGHRFTFDDPTLYRVDEIEQCDLWLDDQSAFRDFITHFERAVTSLPATARGETDAGASEAAAASLRPAVSAVATSSASPLAHVTTFQLERNITGGAAFTPIIAFNLVILAVGSVASAVGMTAGAIPAIVTAAMVLAVSVLGWLRYRKRTAPPMIGITEAGRVGLYRHGRLVADVERGSLSWSAGIYPTGSHRHHWNMPVLLLELPGQKPLTIGTLDRIAWRVQPGKVSCSSYLLGSADFMHLLRSLGLGDQILG